MNTVFYHRADYDGLFSGAICKLFLNKHQFQYIGWDYGDPIPQRPDDDSIVYMVDLNIDCLMDHPKLVWIDHHKSAIDVYDPRGLEFVNMKRIPGLRVDGVAACRLCWQYFISQMFDTKPQDDKDTYISRKIDEPHAVTLVGENDIWDHHDPNTVPLQYGLTLNEINSLDKIIDNYLLGADDEAVLKYIEAGIAAQKWHEIFAGDVLKERSYQRTWEGLKFIILASVHTRSSAWFPDKYIPKDIDAVMAWRYDGKDVKFSLYHSPHRKDIDLSVIAQKYGGGGHRGACGFQLPLEEAIKIIT